MCDTGSDSFDSYLGVGSSAGNRGWVRSGWSLRTATGVAIRKALTPCDVVIFEGESTLAAGSISDRA